VAREEEKRNVCRVLARKPEGKRPPAGVGIEVGLTAIRRKGKERTDHAQVGWLLRNVGFDMPARK
jgi:hypothetical protein